MPFRLHSLSERSSVKLKSCLKKALAYKSSKVCGNFCFWWRGNSFEEPDPRTKVAQRTYPDWIPQTLRPVKRRLELLFLLDSLDLKTLSPTAFQLPAWRPYSDPSYRLRAWATWLKSSFETSWKLEIFVAAYSLPDCFQRGKVWKILWNSYRNEFEPQKV